MIEIEPQDLANRYIALWTEPDSAERRVAIGRLWAEDGRHILQPPVEIREIAAGLGFDHTTLEAQGYDAIEIRVARSYERFVEKGDSPSGWAPTRCACMMSSSSVGRRCRSKPAS
jgi:hypothetical protein